MALMDGLRIGAVRLKLRCRVFYFGMNGLYILIFLTETHLPKMLLQGIFPLQSIEPNASKCWSYLERHASISSHFSKLLGSTTRINTKLATISSNAIKLMSAILPLLAGNFPLIIQCWLSKYL